jgi:protein-L-isoaspartate O-methyltransferase
MGNPIDFIGTGPFLRARGLRVLFALPWGPEIAPFDIIVVAAAPDHVPQALVDQLAPGRWLVILVGQRSQELLLIRKNMCAQSNAGRSYR